MHKGIENIIEDKSNNEYLKDIEYSSSSIGILLDIIIISLSKT